MMHLPKNIKISKEAFVRDFTITCISYSALMPNEVQTCFCGRLITTNFYVFSYFNSTTPINMFTAGPGCGKKLLNEAGIPSPHLFDPFKSSAILSSTNATGQQGSSKVSQITTFSPINREIYNILNLYRCMTHKALEGPLLTVFDFIVKNPSKPVFDSYFNIINHCVNKAIESSEFNTLQEYFENVANLANRRFKKFEFPLIKMKLAELNENSQ